MTDEAPHSDDSGELDAGPVAPPARKRRWKWPVIILLVILALPALVFATWSWIALTYTYSHGERAGYVQKFSDKGWVCKTWEGELSMVNVPGAAQERWTFTVRDDSVADLVRTSMGNKVALSYEEHRGMPTSCFGDTEYFVIGVRRVPGP